MPRPHISYSQSQGDLPDHTCAERLLEVKRSGAEGRSTQMPLYTVSSWLREVCTHGRLLRCTKWGPVDPGKSKWLAKVNSENMAHKSNSNGLKDVTQGLSLSLLTHVVYPHASYFFLWINTFPISVPEFVGILLCRPKSQALLTDPWV